MLKHWYVKIKSIWNSFALSCDVWGYLINKCIHKLMKRKALFCFVKAFFVLSIAKKKKIVNIFLIPILDKCGRCIKKNIQRKTCAKLTMRMTKLIDLGRSCCWPTGHRWKLGYCWWKERRKASGERGQVWCICSLCFEDKSVSPV